MNSSLTTPCMSSKPHRIVVASGNAGKLREFNSLFSAWEIHAVPQSDFGTPEVVEDGDTFVANALLKAHAAAQSSGLPALADDSGLIVDALGGAPGLYSARFAGPGATAADNNAKLLRDMTGVARDQRSARFHCALVYLRHWKDPNPVICEASWEGKILLEPSGSDGFGYDPLFFVEALGCTAAELDATDKNRISHRGQALQLLMDRLQQEFA